MGDLFLDQLWGAGLSANVYRAPGVFDWAVSPCFGARVSPSFLLLVFLRARQNEKKR